MVKFKSRYLLIEVLSGTSSGGVHHSLRIKKEVMAEKILKETGNLFGDLGTGQLRMNFQVLMVNEVTNLMIVRVSREQLKMLQTVLFTISRIDCKDVRIRVIHVSGTIKKIEQHAKHILSKWIEVFELSQSQQELIKLKEETIKLY